MELICTKCKHIIDSTNINIVTDLAKCEHCGTIHKVSSLVSVVEDKALPMPPKGTKIKLTRKSDDNFIIFLPKRDISSSDISILIFHLFIFCIIILWTWFVSRFNIFFVLFSIPFWLIGISTLIGIINNFNETQTIKVDKLSLTLIKSRPFSTKQHKYNFKKIHSIKELQVKENSFFAFSNPMHIWQLRQPFNETFIMPAITTGLGTQYFFEGANDAEQDWIINLLNNKLRQFN